MRSCVTPVVALVVGLVVACGARTLEGTEPSSASDAGAPLDPLCRASRFTRASSCAPAECSNDGACGACEAAEVCTEGRCYRFVGLPLDTPADLLRGLYDDREGFECSVDADGDLEGVEAAVGTGGEVDAIVMTVLAECGGRVVQVAEQRVGTANRLWKLDPPVALKKGGTVRVLFHAEGAKYVSGGGAGVRSGLESVVMHDAVPGCRFVTEVARGLPDSASSWDFVGRLAIHPR
jgi:hypothetical protein